MHLLRQTKEKTDAENELLSVVTQSNAPQSFVPQTISGWPKYLKNVKKHL